MKKNGLLDFCAGQILLGDGTPSILVLAVLVYEYAPLV